MKSITLFSLFTFFLLNTLTAQSDTRQLETIILEKDSLFWQAYNACATEQLGAYISDDVEFYHDKGGITEGLAALAASMKNNLCNNSGFRIRREAVPGTVRVFPLQRSGEIYGAIMSGDHYFYVSETGKKERREGLAKFTHLWLLKDGSWKMSRILSYDHGPAPYINKRKAMTISAAALKQFAGKYKGPQAGTISIAPGNNQLNMYIGGKVSILYPETTNRFFMKERDITVEFVSDQKGKPSKLVVRENDAVVEEAPVIK
jgi:hypothetical protein